MVALSQQLGAALARSALAAAASAGRPVPARSSGPRAGVVRARDPMLLVPVPARRAALRSRGFDPTGQLARVASAQLCRWGFAARHAASLRYARAVADQAGLDVAGRAANVAGALEAAPGGASLADRTLILVDDVITTGATLAEAARGLRAAGAPACCSATIAATPRRRPG